MRLSFRAVGYLADPVMRIVALAGRIAISYLNTVTVCNRYKHSDPHIELFVSISFILLKKKTN